MNQKQKKGLRFTDLGWDKLPICMAKTHLSLSHDPKLKGRPRGLSFPSGIFAPLLVLDFSILFVEK